LHFLARLLATLALATSLTPTSVATPTPTPDGADVTAALTMQRCVRYLPIVERWGAPDTFPDLDPALVLAVMAQESACRESATDETGSGNSIGLMQVIPASWTTTEERLRDAGTNIYWGMRILDLTTHDEKQNPEHSVRRALGAYNCGWESLNAGKCFDFGGYVYADKVLEFWMPVAKEHINAYASKEPTAPNLSRERTVIYLKGWGYGLPAAASNTPSPTPTETPTPILQPTEKPATLLSDSDPPVVQLKEASMPELPIGTLILITLLTMVLWYLLVLIYVVVLKQPKPSLPSMKAGAFIVSIIVGWYVARPVLPAPSEDLFSYGAALLAYVALVFKTAQFVYDLVWSKLMEVADKGLGAIFGRAVTFLSLKRP